MELVNTAFDTFLIFYSHLYKAKSRCVRTLYLFVFELQSLLFYSVYKQGQEALSKHIIVKSLGRGKMITRIKI